MSNQQTHWHMDADVVVVGYGAAGAVAAISAYDCGLTPVIIEKQAVETLASNSFMSGGGIIVPNDVKEATRYMLALSKVAENVYWTDPDTIEAWSVYASENKKWIERFGKKLIFRRHGGEHHLSGADAIDIHSFPGMGAGMMRTLYQQVDSRGIGVMHHTPASRLILDSRGEVIGVQAKSPGGNGKFINIKSRRGVILASGGFEFDEQLKLQFLRVYPAYFTGSPANTGDGIKMALGAGAQLWHMNCCSARLVMKPPSLPFAFDPAFGGQKWGLPGAKPDKDGRDDKGQSPSMDKAGYLVVNRLGHRYTKETFKRHSLYYELTNFDSQRLSYPKVPSYWIFDQTRMADSALVRMNSGPCGAARLYKWSDDNQVELDKGWIKQGNTAKELAIQLNLDPQVLEQTIDNYNRCCMNGVDKDFHREPETLVPLSTPPFYGVELWPGGPNTQGGPRRNGKAQVLRVDGSPIPRLYSAGELGSIYGMLYPASGGNLSECIAFGRIAGENVAELPPL